MSDTIRIKQNQLEQSTTPSSLVVTDVNNNQSFLPPGTTGQVLSIDPSGVPVYTTPLSGWLLQGNSGTNIATDFIGTTDFTPVAFKVNNIEAIRVNTNGNIAIGSSGVSPQRLSIIGTSISNLGAIINNTNSGVTARSTLLFQNDIGNFAFVALNSSTSLDYAGVNSFTVGTVSASPVSIATNNTSRITVSGTGNVGIGTTNPVSNLDIVGSVRYSRRVIGASTTLLATDNIIIVENAATNITINIPTTLHYVSISRGQGSTGTITIQAVGGNIMELNRTVGLTTSLSAAGAFGDNAEFIRHPVITTQINRK